MDVTWNLKKGAIWSDGSPITCDDLQATLTWIMDKAQSGLAADTKCNGIHGNYDVLMHGYTSTPDPTAAYNVYTTQGIPDNPPHNGQNETRVSIPAMDAAYQVVNTSLDPAEIKKNMDIIQDIYGSSQNTFELPFFVHKNVWLVQTKVHNSLGNPTSTTGSWNAGDWWVDQ